MALEQDLCKADGSNYNLPHVCGWIAEIASYATNCIFCGREFLPSTPVESAVSNPMQHEGASPQENN